MLVKDNIAEMLREDERVLELGPLARPIAKGPEVRYFDVLDKEQIISQAAAFGLDTSDAQHIHFVSPTGDMGVINDRFETIVSSHNIEHYPDLVAHFVEIDRILEDDGRYILVIPDKRYCFDYFVPESSIADVLDAMGRTRHSLRALIHARAFGTHNFSDRHWEDDHGAKSLTVDIVRDALQEYRDAGDRYIDMHAWQFTPQGFRRIVYFLRELGLIRFEVAELYPTPYGSIEFCAVLKKAI